MKKLVLLTALAALSACSQKTEEKTETAAPTEEAAPAVAATDSAAPATAPAAGPAQPGTYDVKMADGTMGTTTINADGTYVDTDPKGKTEKGTYASKDGKDCFDPEGDAPEVCWSVTPPAADGSFTATSPDGNTVTVTPKAS